MYSGANPEVWMPAWERAATPRSTNRAGSMMRVCSKCRASSFLTSNLAGLRLTRSSPNRAMSSGTGRNSFPSAGAHPSNAK